MIPPTILFMNYNSAGHSYSNPKLCIILITITIILGLIAICIITYFENK